MSPRFSGSTQEKNEDFSYKFMFNFQNSPKYLDTTVNVLQLNPINVKSDKTRYCEQHSNPWKQD